MLINIHHLIDNICSFFKKRTNIVNLCFDIFNDKSTKYVEMQNNFNLEYPTKFYNVNHFKYDVEYNKFLKTICPDLKIEIHYPRIYFVKILGIEIEFMPFGIPDYYQYSFGMHDAFVLYKNTYLERQTNEDLSMIDNFYVDYAGLYLQYQRTQKFKELKS